MSNVTHRQRLDDKVAIITGATGGIGEATAKLFLDLGAKVMLVARSADKLAATKGRLEAHGEVGESISDAADEAGMAAAVAATVDRFGGLDILIANAGILKAGDVTEFDPADWKRVIDVNLFGYFLSAQAAARVMVEQKSGCIVQINSKSGKKGSFRNSAYAASKFGGIGLTQSLALDLAPHNIRVNAVCPGNLLDGTLWQDSLFDQYAKTQGLTREEVRAKYEGQVPLGRGATYEDVCSVVVFLCSDDASYMTGQAINVTGGQEMR